MKADAQHYDYDFLTALYGQKEVFPLLQTALSLGLFDALAEGRPLEEISAMIDSDPVAAEGFLDVLYHAGLIVIADGQVFNAPVSAAYLMKSSPSYHADFTVINESFLWQQLLLLLGEVQGKHFLAEDFPLQTVLNNGEGKAGNDAPYDFLFGGSLDDDLVPRCSPEGIITVLGYFRGHYGLSGAAELYRKHLEGKDIPILDDGLLAAYCEEHELFCTAPVGVSADYSAVFMARNETVLAKLTLTAEDRLIAALKQLPVHSVKKIDPSAVVTASWVRDHCRFGCSSYGQRHCPPFSPDEAETRTKLADYSSALLIEGQPPTADFQRMMLKAEKTAFKAGFYKAFAYWAGPCSLCTECKKPTPPKKCTATRPSMESAGIDVFATVRGQGYALRTLKDKTEYVKYFGLLLLE
ncbi:MAG TPA: DUF2284 domain-containing protein [Clostridiales bacterium]|nr:DUF2284 domain-containing protein [Clostridiales bacterium]